MPRPPTRAEKTFRDIENDKSISSAKQLPCWQDLYNARRTAAQRKGDFTNTGIEVEEAELFMSLVVPAYNEEDRLGIMLTEAVDYLEQHYGVGRTDNRYNEESTKCMNGNGKATNGALKSSSPHASRGWEILIVSDGSTDKTIETAIKFARDLGSPTSSSIRVVTLSENRGKGGAVTHGMRHVRGKYAVFADADGASKFEDLGKLVQACRKIEDAEGRGVAVGSRAHLVGSEAVVKVDSL